jgi:hypothetical protein
MKVTIEEVRKPESTYFVVGSELGSVECFTYRDDEPVDSIWNRDKAYTKALDYAHALKSGVSTRKTILEL